MMKTTIKQALVLLCITCGLSINSYADTKENQNAQSQDVPAEPQYLNQDVSNPDHLGVYIDALVGYQFANWSGFTKRGYGPWANIGSINPSTNKQGSMVYGADFGYQIIRYLGMEAGYFYMPKVSGDDLNLRTPYLYLAGRVSYPVLDNTLSVFAKLGYAYQTLDYSGTAASAPYHGRKHTSNIMYGIGMQYYLSQNWKASLQWLELPKQNSGATNTAKSAKQIPRVDQILFGLGYLFSV